MNRHSRVTMLAILAAISGGCGHLPLSIKTYAADLPSRADGQYAPLDEPIKKQLVLKDATLQCSIDADDGVEKNSAACSCAQSASEDWVADCKGWLGAHAPQPESQLPNTTLPNS